MVSTVSAEEERPAAQTAVSTTSTQGVREAATRAVRLIDRTSANFLTTRACFTCHTQTLSAMVLRDARDVGIEIDEANFKRQYERAIEDLSSTRVDAKGYALWALDIGRHDHDEHQRQGDLECAQKILRLQPPDHSTTLFRVPPERLRQILPRRHPRWQ